MKKILSAFVAVFLLLAAVACRPAELKKEIIVTYMVDETLFYTESVKEGDRIDFSAKTFPQGAPVKAEDENFTYLFSGWAESKGGEKMGSVEISQDLTVYALFDVYDKSVQEGLLSVTFVAKDDGGEKIILEQKVKSGEVSAPPSKVPAPTGYRFVGWDKDVSAPISARTEFIALYEKRSFSFVRHILGETLKEDVEFESELSFVNPPFQEALKFEGWFCERECIHPAENHKMPAEDYHIFAKFSVDFSSAHLKIPENPVFGGENTVVAAGLPHAENISLSLSWQDGSSGEKFIVQGAGEKEISLRIAAHVDAKEDSFDNETTLKRSFTIAKRPLTIRLLANDIVYGDAPVVTPTFEGLLREEDRESVNLSILFFDAEGKETTAFPVGDYSAEGRVQPMENYEIVGVYAAIFQVLKKELKVKAHASDTTYGAGVNYSFEYDGFAFGEGEGALQIGSDPVRILSGEDTVPVERIQAGTYEILPRLEAFSSPNYFFTGEDKTAFTVGKATINVEIILDKSELTYGETPHATLRRDNFCYADETEESLFGAPFDVEYTGAEPFHAGAYEARLKNAGESENYQIVSSLVPFTIAKKQISVSLPALSSTFGDAIQIPSPTVEGLLPEDEGLKEGILEATSVKIVQGDTEYSDAILRAGEYVLKTEYAGELNDYTVSPLSGSLNVQKRAYEIYSGEVSKSRKLKWSYVPSFSGGEEELFAAEGLLVLNTSNAGVYRAQNADELAPFFEWQTPLKFTLKDGTDVTDCFEVSYDLNITLNNSHFSITLPFSTRTIVYDNAEHSFPITVETEEGDDISYLLTYKVNGSPVDVPKVKDVGEYKIECELSAENYDSEKREYSITVEKAAYTFSGSCEDVEFEYFGGEKTTLPTLSGVGGENVTGNLKVQIEYAPIMGEKSSYPHWVPMKDAGEYAVTLTASGSGNYQDEVKSFLVKIGRGNYGVQTKDQTYTYAPNTAFGEGVEVSVAAGNQFTVEYTVDGQTSGTVPKFSEAYPEGKEISFRVFESNNYLEKTGTYRVTVLKMKGELDVSRINKYFVYTGEAQSITSGASSNNNEDGEISYENNMFTTVKEGSSLVLTVKLKEGRNYTGDEEKVTGFKVDKKTFETLPVGAPEIEEQYNRKGKTLEKVSLPQGFVWKNGQETLVLGSKEYDAAYDPDPDNCNAFPLKVSFSTRKEKVRVNFIGLEADYTQDEFQTADYTLIGEDGETLEKDELYTFETTGDVDREKGGTYLIHCKISVKDNDYSQIDGESEGCVPFKFKTCLLEDKLYTIEDALHAAEGGMIVLKKNTVFLGEEEKSLLKINPYPDESYYHLRPSVKLLVPYKEDDSGSTAQTKKQAQSEVKGEGFRRLTLSKGVDLKVEGTLIVNALRSSEGQRTSMVVDTNFATMELLKDSKVEIEKGGVFESMGFTFGEGEVFVKEGGKAYEPFAMVGWKGGAISAAIRNNVFPINQYTLSSIEAKTHFAFGSEYILRASLTATLLSGEQNLDLTVTFLGDASAFLELQSGEVTKCVKEDKKVYFDVLGNLTFHNLELTLSSTIKFDTSGIQVPIPGNIQISLKDGCAASIPSGVAIKLLPGANAIIDRGATLNIEEGGQLLSYGEKNVAFDGVSAWQDGGNNMGYPHASLPSAYRGGGKFEFTNTTPAKVEVLGTLDAKSGSTVAAELTGDGNVNVSGANKERNITEDKTPAITKTLDKLKALQGQGGTYFHATLKGFLNGVEIG